MQTFHGMGRDLCSTNIAVHGDAAAPCLQEGIQMGMEGRNQQEKTSWMGSRSHRWAVGEAWKGESKEKRDFASIQNLQTQGQTKGREAGSPWRLPVRVN